MGWWHDCRAGILRGRFAFGHVRKHLRRCWQQEPEPDNRHDKRRGADLHTGAEVVEQHLGLDSAGGNRRGNRSACIEETQEIAYGLGLQESCTSRRNERCRKNSYNSFQKHSSPIISKSNLDSVWVGILIINGTNGIR